MPLLKVHSSRPLLIILALLTCFTGVVKADLTWTPQEGWHIEGGMLSGLTGTEGRDALDLMNKARQSEEGKSYRSAIKSYTKITDKFPTSIYAPEAFYRIAQIYIAEKNFYKAFDNYQAILSRYPNVKRFNLIISEEYKIASAVLDGARSRLWFGIPGFTNRERGIGFFEQIVQNAPYSDYAPLALMNVARGHEFLGNTDEAVDALDRLINSYGSSVLAPDAYLRLSKLHAQLVEGSFYDQGETKQAITYSEDFMLLFPSDAKIAEAAKNLDSMKKILAESKVKIGDFYFFKRDNYTAARVFYNEAITSYPNSDVAKLARAKLVLVDAKASKTATPSTQPAKKKLFYFF